MPYKANTYPLAPYPYKIPSPPELSPETIKKLDRQDILRFLHIEALLRSEIVWTLYKEAARRTIRKKTAPPVTDIGLWSFLYGGNRLKRRGKDDAPMRRLLWDESLRNRFDVEDGWAVLLGSHHRYLCPEKPSFRIGDGMVDLSLSHHPPDYPFDLKHLEEKQLRYLYLMIDSAEVSSSDLTQLRNLLRKRQQAALPKTKLQKPPLIKDLQAWLNYLRCYDVRRRSEGPSHGDVGRLVYGGHVGRSRSEQAARTNANVYRESTRACKKVRELIQQAEKGPWVFSQL